VDVIVDDLIGFLKHRGRELAECFFFEIPEKVFHGVLAHHSIPNLYPIDPCFSYNDINKNVRKQYRKAGKDLELMKTKYRKNYWIIGCLVVLVLAVGGFGLKKWLNSQSSTSQNIQTSKVTIGIVSTSISGSGTVSPNQSSTLNWETSGTVAAVNVDIGQYVNAGDVLATLDSTSLDSSIIEAQAELVDAQTALDDLLSPQPLEIAQAEADFVDAQENLDNLLTPSALALAQAEDAVTQAQDALDALKNPSQLSIDQAETAVTVAQENLDSLLNPDPLDIANAESALLTAQSDLVDAQATVDRLSYARGTQEDIDAANAEYILAQDVVDRLQKVYESTKGDPNQDPVKAQALSTLEAAKAKRDTALINLNWYKSSWTEEEIAERNSALATAQATYDAAQKTIDELKSPTAEEIALAQSQVSDAQETLDTLKTPTAVALALAEAQVNDAQEALDTLQNPTAVDIELARQQVTSAQETLDELKNGASESDIIVAKSRVTLAEATLAKSQLVAPFAGTVTNVDVLAGDKVSSGDLAFQIDDLSTMDIDLSISEVDIAQIQSGQNATLAFDAISGQAYTGVVTKVSMVGSVSTGVVNYAVTVQITNGDSAILSGMTASVDITTAESANVLVVPNKAIHTSGSQKTVTLLVSGQQVQVPVTVGLAGDTYTEVTGTALKEGDLVVMTGTTARASASTVSQNTQADTPMDLSGAGAPPAGVVP
jgi:RND family efflux transporter MFP subunit